jgi:hypothetical protein
MSEVIRTHELTKATRATQLMPAQRPRRRADAWRPAAAAWRRRGPLVKCRHVKRTPNRKWMNAHEK